VPELRHLRYFVAVAEELNFSRAAERLHMAQPPLSLAIRQLERELGTELFQRSTREVTLTEPGRAFLDGARRTLAEAERAVGSAKRAAAGDVGRLRVAFSWSVRYETLPTLGQAFRARHPDVEVLAQEMWNAQMLPALRSGATDVAVALCPEVAPDMVAEVIRDEPVVAVLGASHRLAGEQAIPLGSLASEPFVFFPRELAPRLHDVLIGLCRRAGFEPRLVSGSFHTGWDLGVIGETGAVAIAPRSVATRQADGVVTVALSEPGERLETSLVWLDGDATPARESFCALAQTVFAHGGR
jgi:LysR family transcriptional regulator, benzoate and cis,cis-muconate-responsive activator of ben and cat genes